MNTRALELLTFAVNPATLKRDGRYTSPRTWGVYQVSGSAASTKPIRSGNHPVRLQELERQFGRVSTLAVFDREAFAEELTQICNEDPAALHADT